MIQIIGLQPSEGSNMLAGIQLLATRIFTYDFRNQSVLIKLMDIPQIEAEKTAFAV